MALAIDIIDGRGPTSEMMNDIRNVLFMCNEFSIYGKDSNHK